MTAQSIISRYNHMKPGDVFGIYFTSKNRIAHVGFIDEVKANHYVTLEGNTNDAGNIQHLSWFDHALSQAEVNSLL